MFAVRGERTVDVTRPERGERGSFPEVVLASVVGESEGFETFAEPAQQAAGVDLGELAGVADEHHFGVRAFGVVEEAAEGTGADHPGFVDHQDGPGR